MDPVSAAGPGRPPISVVVPTRDRPEHLERCLASLGAAIGPDDEVVVVDSCSGGSAPAAVAAAHRVRLLRCERPGASLARNVGWRAARHDVVAFVDDDVRVDPGWAEAIAAVAAAHPESAFFTGRLHLGAGDAAAEYPIAFIDEPLAKVLDAGAVVDVGHGANLVVRRPALEAVGGYAEELGPGAPWRAAEDLELLDRLVAAGATGRYEPGVSAWHEQWRGRREKLALEWSYGIGTGARLVRLHGLDHRRARRVLRAVAWDGGVRTVAGCLRQRYEFAAAATTVRLAGMVWGASTYAGAVSARRRGRRADPR